MVAPRGDARPLAALAAAAARLVAGAAREYDLAAAHVLDGDGSDAALAAAARRLGDALDARAAATALADLDPALADLVDEVDRADTADAAAAAHRRRLRAALLLPIAAARRARDRAQRHPLQGPAPGTRWGGCDPATRAPR